MLNKVRNKLAYLSYFIFIIVSLALGGFLPKPAFATENGLTGDYYNDKEFTNLATTRIDPEINFDWKSNSPIQGIINTNYFSIRWTGYLDLTNNTSGTYRFYVTADDGYRIFIKDLNKPIMGRWWNNAGYEHSAEITLTGGQVYPIRLEYYENDWLSKIQMSWSGPGFDKEIIPKAKLVPAAVPTPTPTPSPTQTPTPAKIMFGAWVGQESNVFGNINEFENTVGKVPKIRHIYYSNESKTFGIPSLLTNASSLSSYLQAVPLREGEILFISWATDDNSNPLLKTLSQIASGEADLYLDQFIDSWAQAISEVDNEVWINPFWEENACWGWNNWWCAPQQGNETFKQAFRKVSSKFKERFSAYNKTNAKIVWNVDGNSLSNVSSTYPGDDYVDLVSIDSYEAVRSRLEPIYRQTKIAAPNKRIFIAETGQSYGFSAKADQMRAFFNDLPNWAPDLLAVVWFNEPGFAWADSIIGKNEVYRSAFCDSLNLSFIESLADVQNSTCPAQSISTPTPTPSPSPLPTPSQTPVTDTSTIAPPANGLYFGAWVGSAINVSGDEVGFESVTQKSLKIRHFYFSANPLITDAQNFTQFIGNMTNDQYLMFSWLPSPTDSSLDNVISGVHDEYITQWAKVIKDSQRPLFLRLMWADNLNSYPLYWWYSGSNWDPVRKNKYILAFRHVVDKFREAGANNVSFVFSPASSGNGASNAKLSYPGNDYVDWIALSGYPYQGGKGNFASTFGPDYTEFTKADYGSKPLMISEIGAAHGTDAVRSTQIQDILTSVLNYPQFKALVWYNEPKSRGGDLLINYPQSLNILKTNISTTYFIGR